MTKNKKKKGRVEISKQRLDRDACIYLISWGSGSQASAGNVCHQIFHAPQRDILIDTPSSGHSFQRNSL